MTVAKSDPVHWLAASFRVQQKQLAAAESKIDQLFTLLHCRDHNDTDTIMHNKIHHVRSEKPPIIHKTMQCENPAVDQFVKISDFEAAVDKLGVQVARVAGETIMPAVINEFTGIVRQIVSKQASKMEQLSSTVDTLMVGTFTAENNPDVPKHARFDETQSIRIAESKIEQLSASFVSLQSEVLIVRGDCKEVHQFWRNKFANADTAQLNKMERLSSTVKTMMADTQVLIEAFDEMLPNFEHESEAAKKKADDVAASAKKKADDVAASAKKKADDVANTAAMTLVLVQGLQAEAKSVAKALEDKEAIAKAEAAKKKATEEAEAAEAGFRAKAIEDKEAIAKAEAATKKATEEAKAAEEEAKAAEAGFRAKAIEEKEKVAKAEAAMKKATEEAKAATLAKKQADERLAVMDADQKVFLRGMQKEVDYVKAEKQKATEEAEAIEKAEAAEKKATQDAEAATLPKVQADMKRHMPASSWCSKRRRLGPVLTVVAVCVVGLAIGLNPPGAGVAASASKILVVSSKALVPIARAAARI